MVIYVANVRTDSGDEYSYLYSSAPTRAQVIKQVWKDEGEIEDLDWYMGSTRVDILPEEVTLDLPL